MPSIRLETPDGFLILCGVPRPRFVRCKFPDGCLKEAAFECDFPTRPGKTCNLGFCKDHGRNVGYDQDHCWKHARHAAAQQRLLI